MNERIRIMNKEIIYSKNAQKVLAFLCDHSNKSFYSNQIAEKVNLSKGGISQTLRSLAKERLLKSEKKGKMLFYQIEASSPIIRQFKVFRTIILLNPLVKKLQLLSEKVVLFGSCAEGANTEDSDIDLLVMSSQKDAVGDVFNKFKSNQNIQLILKSPQEYISLEKKEPIFFSEIEKGIPLWQKV